MKKYLFTLVLQALLFCSPLSAQETTAPGYCFDHGPYLQGLTYSDVYVYFTTSQKGFSWIDLRAVGEKEYTRCVTIDDGLIEANNTKNAIHLQKLSPNTSYEYRLVSVPVNQFRLSQNIYGDTIRTPWYTFKTLNPDGNTCSFITTSDIHDDAEKYERLLSYMPLEKTDMVFLLGDILSHFSRVGQPYSSFIDVSVDKFAKERPFVLVRGNHDTRGALARTYPDYIYRPDNHFYGTYQFGNIFVVLLDNGEDKPDTHHDYSGITAFDDYRVEQLEWLKKVIQSDEYKNAAKRIILTHIPPIPRGESTRASVHTADFLYREYLPVLNTANVDLMIAGHTHRFMLIEPGNNPNYQFPILVNDNKSASYVQVSPAGISVKTINDQGTVTLEKTF
ncbi:metallophosphoesterase [Bacteroidales bacterium OttesenSCG-928-A17]|nr:metallophosphoesterase [Bacteroidales bacterium OttesenSCG-928-A17]